MSGVFRAFKTLYRLNHWCFLRAKGRKTHIPLLPVDSISRNLHAHSIWHWVDSPLPVLCPQTSPLWNLTAGTIIIPQLLAPNLWPGSECEEMLCCQLEGSGFSPDEWRKGSVTPVNDPQRPLVSCPGTTQWPPLRVIEEPKWPLL